MLSVTEVASQLGVSPRRVRALIQAQRLQAQSVSGVWVIDAAELARFQALERKPGRPKTVVLDSPLV